MKLNLGSGWDNREGYVNVDFAPHHKPDLAADVLNLPIADGAIEEILAQDVLEHLPRTSTTEALAEWRRVTKADGVARIRVPSLFHAVDLMRSADTLSMHQILLQNLYGTQAYAGDVHLTSFTDRTLADALHSAGYRRVCAELVDHWLWDVTAWACSGQPLALFWGAGFHPEEGGGAPLDYQRPSAGWRWSGQDSSMSLINTGETCLRAILSLTLRADHAPDGSITVRAGGREWLSRVGAPVRIEISVTPSERVEIVFHARLDRLDVGDPRELFFRVEDSVLRVEADSGPREPLFHQAPPGDTAEIDTLGNESALPLRHRSRMAAFAVRALSRRAASRATDRLAGRSQNPEKGTVAHLGESHLGDPRPAPLVDPTLGQVDDTRNASYDEQTIRIIGRAVRPGDTCIDVGAHIGGVLKYMVAASDAPHLAFEPLPELAAGLRRDFPIVDVHEVALSTEEGLVSFQRVATNPAYSGLLLRHLDRDGERVETITVRSQRLDDITDPAVPIRLIKIDVEGAELGVLKGGEDTIQRDRPLVVFEHGLGAADVYGTRPQDIFDLFDGWGYGLTTMASWLAEPPVMFSRSQFVEQFEGGINYYFMAMPTSS
jgi:FkbM family methyltransferase